MHCKINISTKTKMTYILEEGVADNLFKKQTLASA